MRRPGTIGLACSGETVNGPSAARAGPARLMSRALIWLGLLIASAGAPWAQPLRLTAPPLLINDGDTFEADLNGNGKLDLPGERVRLLYVDTPELHQSHKGKDLLHGLPARAYLEEALAALPIVLLPQSERRHDRYGRMLAVVRAGGSEINLELIRRGHSYFDTRYSLPEAYDLYARAEAQAFEARLGIWSTEQSRQSYLKRLRKELKTPRAIGNKLYATPPADPAQFEPAELLGKFIRLEGRLAERKMLRNGARLLFLETSFGKPLLRIFLLGRMERKLHSDGWPGGVRLLVEGFIKKYRGAPEMVLHYGRIIPE